MARLSVKTNNNSEPVYCLDTRASCRSASTTETALTTCPVSQARNSITSGNSRMASNETAKMVKDGARNSRGSLKGSPPACPPKKLMVPRLLSR